ncbi:hypothetical protein FRB98_008551 [Tulasnella sp. 332]|nr:hypothetical protein FRB98_008551 [Tulasnella sp. 332]
MGSRTTTPPSRQTSGSWSLPEDLTVLSVDLQHPSCCIVTLLHPLGVDTLRAGRNVPQPYGITSRGGNIYDLINELIILVQIFENEEIIVESAGRYALMIEKLEKYFLCVY